MKKIISATTWAKIKAHYVVGRDTIGKIAENHEVSRKSIERKANKEGWTYGKLSDDVAKEVEESQIAKIKKNDCDIISKIARQFIGDAKKIRNITIATLKELEGKKKLNRAALSRILATQKINNYSAKTIIDLYMAVRKSLGMDKEAPRAHIEINAQNQTVITDKESSKLFADAMEKDK